jgi:hypothetical protein
MTSSERGRGRSTATISAMRPGRGVIRTLAARMVNWQLNKGDVTRWGESNMPHYQAYLDFLLTWGVLKQPMQAPDLVTNDLLAEIDDFDPGDVAGAAKAYRYARP